MASAAENRAKAEAEAKKKAQFALDNPEDSSVIQESLANQTKVNQGLKEQIELERTKNESSRSKLMADVEAGRAFGKDVLGEEGLGRLGDDEEIQGVLKRLDDVSQTGLSGAESVAQREKAFQGIGQATQTAERAFLARAGSRGLRGGNVGAGLQNIQVQGLQSRAGVERDLFLQSEGIKRDGLKDFADALGQVKTFDLGQAAREKDIEISAGLGFGEIGSAERTAASQAKASQAAASARSRASCFMTGTQVSMYDGSFKSIELIQCGDVTSSGEVYGCSQHMVASEDVVSYKGIFVSKYHPVCEDGTWLLPKDSERVNKDVEYVRNTIPVFNLWTSLQRIEIQGENGEIVTFTDYEGMEVESEEIIKKLNREAKSGIMVKVSNGKIR